MGDSERELESGTLATLAYHKCRGCGHFVRDVQHVGHAPGCMLREDNWKHNRRRRERHSGKTIHFPGMTNFCPRCHQLRPDGEIRHTLCPMRLPQ